MNTIGKILRYREWDSALSEFRMKTKEYNPSIDVWFLWYSVIDAYNAYRAMERK